MPIKVRCPSCSEAFKTSSKNRGQRVDCPICGASIRVSNRKKSKKQPVDPSGGEGSAGEPAFDEEIAAVLADDNDFPPREYVPSGFDSDHSEVEDPSSSSISSSGISSGGISKLESTAVAGNTEPRADLSGDSFVLTTADAKPAAPDAARSALLFGAGVLVGAAVASVGWMMLGARSAPSRVPPPAPAGPKIVATDIEAAAPPESDDEKAAQLAKVSIRSARFEEVGGLLGKERRLTFDVVNESGLVLQSVTLKTELSLAAFSDGSLATEQVVVPFSPSLGVGEEQVVTVPAPDGGSIAAATLSGPVRLTAKVVDIAWQADDSL